MYNSCFYSTSTSNISVCNSNTYHNITKIAVLLTPELLNTSPSNSNIPTAALTSEVLLLPSVPVFVKFYDAEYAWVSQFYFILTLIAISRDLNL
jgi:hypothetical protein